jgi:hypothetical protein
MTRVVKSRFGDEGMRTLADGGGRDDDALRERRSTRACTANSDTAMRPSAKECLAMRLDGVGKMAGLMDVGLRRGNGGLGLRDEMSWGRG